MKRPGLYANIHAKRLRIKKGSGERMRGVGAKGRPTAKAFKDSAKTDKTNYAYLKKKQPKTNLTSCIT